MKKQSKPQNALMEDKDKLIAKLQSEIGMLKSILYQMPGNVYWQNPDDIILGCNENIVKLLNLSSDKEVVGKKMQDFVPVELADKIKIINDHVMQKHEEATYEEIGFDKTGKKATYISRKSPFYDDHNKLVGILGVSFDITREKELAEKLKRAKEKAEKANLAKTKFLAMVNHEMRTPLTSILGFAHFLQDSELDNETRIKYIEYINNSGNYLLTLVNQILDFSKSEANKIKSKPMPFNLHHLFDNVKKILEGVAVRKNLSINIEYDPKLPELIISDPNLIQQILINLVGNAIKFTKEGSVTIRARCIKKIKSFYFMQLAVIDTGIGIPAEKLKMIFKEFFQVEDIYARDISITGTGLGLAIVKKLAKAINTKVNVTSKLNKGSVFSMIIKATVPDTTTVENHLLHHKKERDQSLIKNKIKVLLVEDDDMVRLVHEKMLSQLGCNVISASNASEALQRYSDEQVLIFVDLGLPDISGFELIKKLRKEKKSEATIVALTGFSLEEEKGQCMKVGADNILVKPASYIQFNAIIEKLNVLF